jgi:hypothetical protein
MVVARVAITQIFAVVARFPCPNSFSQRSGQGRQEPGPFNKPVIRVAMAKDIGRTLCRQLLLKSSADDLKLLSFERLSETWADGGA